MKNIKTRIAAIVSLLSLSALLFSSCATTLYSARVEKTASNFTLTKHDSIGIFRTYSSNERFSNAVCYETYDILRQYNIFHLWPPNKIDSALVQNNIFGQPISWNREFLAKLAEVLPVRYLINSKITNFIPSNMDIYEGVKANIRFRIFDLKKQQLVWKCMVSADQSFMEFGIVLHITETTILRKMVEKMHKRRLSKVIDYPFPEVR